MRWLVVREWCAKIALAAALMVFGAHMWTLYLHSTEPTLAASIDRLDDWFGPTLFALLVLHHWLRPEKDKGAYNNISPRVSGSVTVMLVGAASAIALVTYNVAFATGVWLLSILVAIAIWRFATKNANEIGEATFRVASD